MLFDPLEEQLDLPATAIKLRNGERRQAEVVGQKDQLPPVLDIVIAHAPQGLGILLRDQGTSQHDRLIAAQSARLVDRAGFAPQTDLVALGANDKECRLPM